MLRFMSLTGSEKCAMPCVFSMEFPYACHRSRTCGNASKVAEVRPCLARNKVSASRCPTSRHRSEEFRMRIVRMFARHYRFADPAWRAACGRAQTMVALTVGCGSTEFDAEAYYAKELGFFQKAGLNVDIQRLRGGPDVQAAVAGGTFQIGDTNVLSLASAKQHGQSITVIAPGAAYTAAAPTSLLVVMPDAPIHTAQDLAGKNRRRHFSGRARPALYRCLAR